MLSASKAAAAAGRAAIAALARARAELWGVSCGGEAVGSASASTSG